MATTGKIAIDEGTTTNTATYTISEDAVTKHITRIVPSKSDGTEIGTSAAPIQVSLANTGANTNKLLVTPDLPSGAATAAKQPALGTAGTASADVLTVQGKASMTPLLVDGSAVTQPVSGTFWQATQPVSGTLTANLGTAGTAATSVGKAEDAAHSSGDVGVMALAVREATATDLSAGNTDGDYEPLQVDANGKLWVNPGTVPITANSTVDVNKLAGTTTDTNSGTKSAGTLRVVLATDQPALTNKLLVTPDANSAVNVAQMNGVTTAMGVGASSTGTQRTVQANDAGKTLVSAGGSAASSGNNTLISAGTNKLKVYAFSLSTTSTTAVTCIFQSGASGTELWRVVLQAVTGANTGANLSISPPASLFATASATLLNLNLSGAQTVHWSLSYFDEA